MHSRVSHTLLSADITLGALLAPFRVLRSFLTSRYCANNYDYMHHGFSLTMILGLVAAVTLGMKSCLIVYSKATMFRVKSNSGRGQQ
jgi:hypothetical protein